VFDYMKRAVAGQFAGGNASIAQCLPCYCRGIGWANKQGTLPDDQLLAARTDCAQYIAPMPNVRAFAVG
jgi:hypothetical protein